MFRFNHDYGSRFRILKGGKISLVVSAMLLGTVSASAYNITVSNEATTCGVASGGVITATQDCNIQASAITSALSSGSLEINTGLSDGNLTILAPISYGANSLTLTATNDIHLAANVDVSNSAGLLIKTGFNGTDANSSRGLLYVDMNDDHSFKGKVNLLNSSTLNINGNAYMIIRDADALHTFRTSVGIYDYTGYYALGSDITMSGDAPTSYRSVGDAFNGLGHTISGYSSTNGSNTGGGYIGFLRGIKGGDVSNIAFVDANITGDYGLGVLTPSIEGVAGKTAKVFNIYASGTLTETNATTSNGVGGIANSVDTWQGSVYAKNLHSNLNINATGAAAGIFKSVGSNSATTTGTFTMESCSASGNITTSVNDQIAGVVLSTYTNGSVTYNFSDLSFDGTITGNGTAFNYIYMGGVIGVLNGAATGTNIVNNIRSNATISNITENTTLFYSTIGGAIGAIYGANNNISNATFTGDITTRTKIDFVGGILGNVRQASTNTLTDSVFSGSIETGTSNRFIGGIVGGNEAGTITVSNSVSRGTLEAGTGSTYVGGVIGRKRTTTGIVLENNAIEKLPTVSGTQPTVDYGVSSAYFGKISGDSTAGTDSGNIIKTTFNAEVSTDSPTFEVNASLHGGVGAYDGSALLGGVEGCDILEGSHRYFTQTFIATSTADRNISTTSLTGFNDDNFMAVYEGVFDENNITKGLIGCNDDRDYDNGDYTAEFATSLEDGKSYTMVFTAYSDVSVGDEATTGSGSFTVTPEVSLAYSLGGTVSGLENGETLTLSGIGSTDEVITENGSFVFDTPLANSVNYTITANLTSSNEFRSCEVTNGTGTIASANVDNISISCTEDVNYAPTFSYGNGATVMPSDIGKYDRFMDVALQPDGKVVAIGNFKDATSGDSASWRVVRFNVDGTLDTTFSTDGIVEHLKNNTTASKVPWDITLQSDGKIVVSGYRNTLVGGYNTYYPEIIRLNSDGSFDNSFGTSGVYTNTNIVSNSYPTRVGIQSDGKIVYVTHNYSQTNNYIARIDAVGSALDTSFDTDGMATISGIELRGFLLDNDDKSVAIGYPTGYVFDESTEFEIQRFDTNGVLDGTFGGGDGKLTVDLGVSGFHNNDATLIEVSDGYVISIVNSTKYIVAKVKKDGTMDSTFGTNGVFTYEFTKTGVTSLAYATATAQPDGKIVVLANLYDTPEAMAIRVNTNGTIDTTFGVDGKSSVYIDNDKDYYTQENPKITQDYSTWPATEVRTYDWRDRFMGMTSDSLGNIIFVGVTEGLQQNSNQHSNAFISRLSANGQGDPTFGTPIDTLSESPTYYEMGDGVVVAKNGGLFDRDLYLAGDNYNGVTVSLSRDGGANEHDIFDFISTNGVTVESTSLKLDGITIGTVANGSGTLAITFTANVTQEKVNKVIRSITYKNSATTAELPSSVTLAWSAKDGNSGTQGSGGEKTAQGTTTVAIQLVPKSTDGSVLATEETSYTFSTSDFGTYTPVGSETEFAQIKITSLPTNGTLKNSGSNVNIGDVIDSYNIGSLTFTPNKDVYGNTIDGFGYQVGTYDSNNNMMFSPTYTMELNVSGVNDAPTFKLSEGVSSVEIANFSIDEDATEFLKVQSDGKILVAGKSEDENEYDRFDIRRFNADWTLDTSFGMNGIVTFDMGTSNYDYPTNMTTDNDGSIYLTGMARGSSRDFVVVKLNNSGTLVNNFGDSGKKIIDLSGSSSDYALKIMVLENGEILAGGYDSSQDKAVLVKLSSDTGEAVSSFGTNGILFIDKANSDDYDAFRDATLWNIGGEQKIVLSVPENDNTYLNRLMVLNSDGTPYTSFGLNGIYSNQGKYFYSFLPLENGDMLVAGYDDDESSSVLFKLTSTGTLETLKYFNFGSRIKELKKDSEGNIYGVAYTSGDGVRVAKFSSSGVMDANFGDSGVKTFTLDGMDESNSYSIDFDKNGNLLVYVESWFNDWNDQLSSIIILDKTTGAVKTIGGESSLGQSVAHNRSTPTVVDSDVTIKDSELDGTSYNGATITLAREGGASSEDHFSFTDTISVSGNTLSLGDTLVGTFSLLDGNMTITFGDVNTSVVNTTLRNITYQNTGSGDANVTIAWKFNDGNNETDGEQGSGGAKIAIGTTEVIVTGTYTPPNSAPTAITLSSTTVDENVDANTTVAILSVTDADVGDTHIFSLVSGNGSTDNGSFTIDGTSLKIKTSPNFETKSSYSIRLKVVDAFGASFEDNATITVLDINEPAIASNMAAIVGPSSVNLFSTFIPTFSDPEGDLPTQLKITTLPSVGKFEKLVDNNWIEITSTDLPLIIDMTDLTNYRYNSTGVTNVASTTVEWSVYTSGGWSNSTTGVVTIVSLEDNHAPDVNITMGTESINDTIVTINEDSVTNPITVNFNDDYTPAQFLVGVVDSNNSALVGLEDINITRVSDNNVSVVITPKANMYGDVNITLGAFDGDKNGTKSFILRVNPVNDLPTDINITNLAIRENNELNATIGTLSTVDIDTTDTHTYSLDCGTSNDNNKFFINGNSLKARESFNYEEKTSYNICVKTTDSGDESFEKNMIVSIEDVLEDYEISIVEAGTGTTISVPANEPLTYIPAAREGYTFAGWYTDENFETAFDPRNPITANTTLYPKWIAQSNNSVTMSVNTMAYGVREVTISTSQGLTIANATNNETQITAGKIKLPFGTFSFDISGGTNGFTAPMSIVVDKDVGSFTYYKQNNSGKWVNLTKKITFLANDKVQIDFDLVDGGVFDRDGSANGTIVDPGGVATNALNPYVIAGTTLVGDASFVEDPSVFVGTLNYAISGGTNSSLFQIDSSTGELSFINPPTYHTTSSNNYFVEVTASGSTSGKEIRAIMVTVLNANGDNAIAPVVVAESCGTSARQNLIDAPTTGLCESGIASAVNATTDMFTWNCNNGDESTQISCSAKKVTESTIVIAQGATVEQTQVNNGTTQTVTSGTNTIEATKFTTGDAKTEHIAKANGTELSKATSFIEGTQITVDSTGNVETKVDILGANNTPVSITVDGKVSGEDKAIHTVSVGGKVTKAKSKITGTVTQIKVDGEVETKATVNGNEATATALSDGTATHIVKVGTIESKATIGIAGAETTIDTTGVTTSVEETQTIGGNNISVKSVVKTDTQGESQTWFEDSNGQQLERTVSSNTPLESGAEIKVGNDTNGKVQFIIETKVTRDLVIE